MVPVRKLFGGLANSMFQYAFLYAHCKENGLDIYLQDPKYFEKYKDDILMMYRQGIGEPINCVAIHVRRGDYLQSPAKEFHVNLCDTDYYEQAIAMFPNQKFLVFSDDISWCKLKWGDRDEFSFSEGQSEIDDMNLMASCKSIIIANSSYSFWAAYIAPYVDKVVCPKYFYYDKIERTKCPTEWIRI